MGTSAQAPAAGSEAPVRNGAETPAAPVAPPRPPGIAEAAAAARALLEGKVTVPDATPAAPATPAAATPASETTDDELVLELDTPIVQVDAEEEARWNALTPEEQLDEDPDRVAQETAAREAAAATPAADAELEVEFPSRNAGEVAIKVTYPDKESADAARAAIRGSMRGDQARQVREEAARMRDDAEGITYAAKVDPAGLIASAFTPAPNADAATKAAALADQAQLARYLLTRPGVLESMKEWVNGIIAQPEVIPGEGELVEARLRNRRDEVQAVVTEERQLRSNGRALLGTLEKTVDTMAPATWDETAKKEFKADVLRDLTAFGRKQMERYFAENPSARQVPLQARLIDPRAVSGLVQRRFKLYGVAPRSAAPAAVATPGRPGTRPVTTPAATPAALLAGRAARRAGASAPPGAGSPVAQVPKPPKGAGIKEAAKFARDLVASWSRKPT